jgi:hemoglobin/transferrin/lactoferrin receptor protein
VKVRHILIPLLLPFFSFAQEENALRLTPERLSENDVVNLELSRNETMVISATRSPEKANEQPFTVWVITAGEILQNGFVTLGDVLRAAPGIRVSQPGNALEGETFMVRGLSGNQYMKILINDVPIKAAIAPGMSIGAQLPIRQAERIEVVFGPSGSTYGDEACAGVINIILKETERPVYTQADLSFGRFNYNSLDLMFGGKLGRDRNIFRYSIYGSSTIRDNADYYYDPELFNTNRYLPFGLDSNLYVQNNNYRGVSSAKDSIARTNSLSHESRLFGVNMTWRGLHFTYHRLARFDRSVLGLNPLAVSYANPSNRIAERLETFSLGFRRTHSKWTTYNTFALESYQIRNSSTTNYVFDRLSAANFIARRQPGMSPQEEAELLKRIYNWYASDERYTVANGADLRIESRIQATVNARTLLHAGGQLHGGGGIPAGAYYQAPVSVSLDGTLNPDLPLAITPETEILLDGNFFAHLDYHGPRLHLIGGGSLNVASGQNVRVDPRIGVSYMIDSFWIVRANASSGFRNGSLYGNFNSFIIDQSQNPVFRLTANAGSATTESFFGSELGIRYNASDGSGAEILGFWQQSNNLYRPGYLLPGDNSTWYYGYMNAPGKAGTILGAQLISRIGSKTLLNARFSGKSDRFVTITGRSEFYVQYSQGKEFHGYNLPDLNFIPNMPAWIVQWRNYIKINKKTELNFAYTHIGDSKSKSVIYRNLYQLGFRPETLGRYGTVDLTARVFLSKQFLVYCNFQNIFDREHAGLDASGTPDDLIYNPQPGRFVRLGVNYNMN